MSKLYRIMLIAMTILSFNVMPVSAADTYSVIYNEIVNCRGDADTSKWITDAICYASNQYGVDPLLITALMEAESSFDFNSYSSAGAIGLMQLMPETAAMVGVDPYAPLSNILGGTCHLKTLLDSFNDGSEYAVTNAVAAYNAGSGAVRQYGGCPPYSETINYVNRIAVIYQSLLNSIYN